MPKLQRKKDSKTGGYFITVPGELVNKMKWRENDILYWYPMDENGLRLDK